MSDNPNIPEGFGRVWLERGIAAARAGRRSEARESLFRALNDEAQREMAWLWLAAVSDDPRQEQMYLEKVLELNPDNLHARAGIAHLEKRGLKDLPSLSETAEDSIAERRPQEKKPAALPAKKARSADEKVSLEKTSGSLPAASSALGSEGGVVESEMIAVSTEEPSPTLEEPAQDNVEPLLVEGKDLHEEAVVEDDKAAEKTSESDYDLESILPEKFQKLEELVSGAEPTGWTTHTPVVEKPAPVQHSSIDRVVVRDVASPRVGPQYSDYSDYLPPRPVRRRINRPTPQWRRLLHSEGQISMIVNEAFNDHEMWAVLASTVGLILLAFVLAFFFILRLVSS